MLNFERKFSVCSSDKAGVRVQKGRKTADLVYGWTSGNLVDLIARSSLGLQWQDVYILLM